MSDGLRKGEQLAARLLEFGVQILAIIAELPNDLKGKTIAHELVRCGPVVGAHYEEARGAESRADFVHKLGVALKELRESVHWLKLIARARLLTRDLTPLIREGTELIAMLTASSQTARFNLTKSQASP